MDGSLWKETPAGNYFEVELIHPPTARRLCLAYRIRTLDFLKG